jgi:hypothetical protein
LLTELELMEIQVNVLFQHDSSGRMTHVNEHPHDIAPRFFLGATKYGNVIRYLNALEGDIVKELEQLINTDSSVNLAEIIRILSQDQQIRSVEMGPAFLFPEVRNRFTKAIQITPSNKELLKPNFPFTFDELEYKQPCFAVIENDIAVSVCCSARQTSEAAEASLATIVDYRGKAYGVDVSNAWAAQLQSQNRLALYSTSWNNFASQTVAKKLQLIQYGIDIHIS